jgi:aminocarboxymuconate-semialdehyde decarboxylase
LRGVYLHASIEGSAPVDQSLFPIYEAAERLNLPLVLHPVLRAGPRPAWRTVRVEVGFGWLEQTSLAALGLVEGGVLDAYPSLKILHPHLGGVLPYLAGRLERMPGRADDFRAAMRRNFWADAVSQTAGALALAVGFYGADRIVFATDYPFLPMSLAIEYLSDQPEIMANVMPGLL